MFLGTAFVSDPGSSLIEKHPKQAGLHFVFSRPHRRFDSETEERRDVASSKVIHVQSQREYHAAAQAETQPGRKPLDPSEGDGIGHSIPRR